MPDREDQDERDAMAGELALGVLTGDERAAALRRVLAEPGFAAEVEGWRRRLAPLLDGIAEVAAPATAWPAIERAIAAPAGASVWRWRAAALSASAIAASLLVVVVARPERTVIVPAATVAAAPQIPLLAQVAGDAGSPIVTAHYDAASGQLRVRTANLPVGERVPELWVIVGDSAPRSLGFVAHNGASSHMTSADLRRAMIDGATIAITMEPRSPTPHAAPSGPVLGTATLTSV